MIAAESATEHGLNTALLISFAVALMAWSLFSRRLARWSITSPIVFIVFGVAFTHGLLSAANLHLSSASVRAIAEITLALVLFVDASSVDLAHLRHDAALPARLLGIALPLTILLGFVLAVLIETGSTLWIAALLAAIVAPTDAALGAPVMEDRRVPERIRTALNVESGLNDGIATPFVGLFLAGAVAETAGGGGAVSAIVDLLGGAAIGIAVGVVGAVALRLAHARRMVAERSAQLVPLALAILSYAAAVEVGCNGFVAAFAGGMAFGAGWRKAEHSVVEFAEASGALLSLATWFLFGAVMLVPGLEHLTWRDVLFAVLALTVMRMVPTAIACIGSGLDRYSVFFLGWFGPRGLASVIFGLLAFDSLPLPEGERVLSVVTATVGLSVLVHGLSAVPLGARFGKSATLPR